MGVEELLVVVPTQLIIRKGVTQLLFESVPGSRKAVDCAATMLHKTYSPTMLVFNPPEKRIPIFPPTEFDIQGPRVVYAVVWEHNKKEHHRK